MTVFMRPQYTREDYYLVETTHGTEAVPCVLSDHENLSDYLHGAQLEKPRRIRNHYWVRLSAPGYMDATDWAGPFETMREARAHVVECWEADPDTGDELTD